MPEDWASLAAILKSSYKCESKPKRRLLEAHQGIKMYASRLEQVDFAFFVDTSGSPS